ncbi:MAG TPA: DUF3662 and FHA domain-containing protein [Acidimicrobiales bacterium]|nr:DUF3662 and FHA domain-containing protein [Acidimicrobiales bacterium]
MGLEKFEQRLERLVEGAFAKAFRGELQPVEVGRRLTREMDLHRTVSVRGLVAPNCFEVDLSKEDYARLGGLVKVLANELVDAAREHAKNESYAFMGPVEVTIEADEGLAKSTFSIDATFVEGEDTQAAWLVMADDRRIAIGEETLTIGRLPDCSIPINDPNASRRHAQVRLDGEVVYLLDLGSTNGTKVNGSPVRQHRLQDGDVIMIGTTAIRFESRPR